MTSREGDCWRRCKLHSHQSELTEPCPLDHGLDIQDPFVQCLRQHAVGQDAAARVEPDHSVRTGQLPKKRLNQWMRPLEQHVADYRVPAKHDRRPHACHGVSDAHAVGGGAVADFGLHHAGLAANTRTGSPTPLSACSPRSSNTTSAEVRARPRTMSETSTSPGTERPAIREAMLTAPPYTS